MANIKNDIPSNLSELTDHNISFFFSSSKDQSSISKKSKKDEGKKIFEVFHKKEIVYPEKKSEEKKENCKKYRSIQYKCFYCQNILSNINRYESHIKIHVSNISFLIFKNKII